MMRVLDDQPILGSSVSGQRCIRSAGALPLAKYHPYVQSSYFKGQLQSSLIRGILFQLSSKSPRWRS